MKKSKRIALVFVLSLAAAAVAGRISARMAASDYERRFKAAVSMVGVSGFGDTANLREFLASPEMAKPVKRMRALSFLGGGYRVRAEELERGMIYLSEQMALPEEQRFSSPPALAHLSLVSSDRTNGGIGEAAKRLLASYEAHL